MPLLEIDRYTAGVDATNEDQTPGGRAVFRRDPSLFERLGERLRVARRRMGITQTDVAERMGTQQSYISALENNTNQPGVIALVVGLADTYRVSLDYLAGLSDDPTPARRRDLTPPERDAVTLCRQLSEDRCIAWLELGRSMLDQQEIRRRLLDEDPELKQMLDLIELRAGPEARRRAEEYLLE